MFVITLITKRSSREIIPQLQYPKFRSSIEFEPGSVIEIIDGNKKSPCFVYSCEPLSAYKQLIRSGNLDLKKIRLSKTGEFADGIHIAKYPILEIDRYMSDNSSVKNSDDAFIRSFFPIKKAKKTTQKVVRKKVDDFSKMDVSQYFNNKPQHHSRMHELVDTIRNYFGDKANTGTGSFSYYLGFFKKIPDHEVQRMFEEAKRSNKDLLGQKKLFWWKIGQYIKGE